MTSYLDRRRLDGRHVVITGAYGAIGRAVCRRVHAEGATITAIDRRGDPDDPLWRELGADFLALDLSADAAETAAALDRIDHLHGLANVAAVDSPESFPDYRDEEFARVFDINVRGPLHLMQSMRPRMRAGTSIVNVITMDALAVVKTTEKSTALYAASKAALAMLTRELAAELGPDDIRVNGVAPGLTDTPMSAPMSDVSRTWLVERTALGRIGQPRDIGDAIAFLLSPAARFVTGQVLAVDGGLAATLDAPPELGRS